MTESNEIDKDIEEQIRKILFELGKDIKLHKIDNDNMVIEIDYDKYLLMLKDIIRQAIEEQT